MSNFHQTIKSLSDKFPCHTFIVAFSGGVDSQALLHLIADVKANCDISNDLLACHVNHGLSENSNDWQVFAQQQCDNLGITFKAVSVEVENKQRTSWEAQARDARYDALLSLAAKFENAIILTGHHNDDQIETFLLAMKRGAGIKGLSSIAEISSRQGVIIARPLLTFSRAEIEQYAQEQELKWIEDESNSDTTFDRNFLRHDVVPILKARWPAIGKTIGRSAQHCSESQLLLDELAAEDLSKCLKNKGMLDVSALLNLSRPRFNNLIRYYLELRDMLMPSAKQLEQLYSQLTAADDKTPAVSVGKHVFRRFGGALYLTKHFESVSGHEIDITEMVTALGSSETGKQIIELPDALGSITFIENAPCTEVPSDGNQSALKEFRIIRPVQGTKISIRFRHHNPSCWPDFRQKRRPLKKVLQELSIAPWQRKRLPLLYYDEELVAVVGYFVCKEFVATTGTNNLTVNWQTQE